MNLIFKRIDANHTQPLNHKKNMQETKVWNSLMVLSQLTPCAQPISSDRAPNCCGYFIAVCNLDGGRVNHIKLWRTFRFSKVRPSTQSAPPHSGITLNPQPAADIGHAATPYGYSGGLNKFKLNCK